MAELTTSYMGLKLKNPLIIASSGLTKSAEGIVRCAEAGAGAVVMKSIFEEQYWEEVAPSEQSLSYYPEALDYLRKGSLLEYAPQEKCEIIKKVKEKVDIPVIASINCQSPELWTEFAHQFQEAGADGLELNIYFLPFDLKTPGTEYEKFHLEILEKVKKSVSIPVAVKLTFQLTSVPFLAYRLAKAGCDALVLFNWFLQPDVNVKNLQTRNIIGKGNFHQSLRWVALLAERIDCDIAASGGVQKAEDLIKQILVGAAGVQVCTLLYQKGLEAVPDLLNGLEAWMNSRRYSSIDDFKGILSFKKQELAFKQPVEAKAYFRTQYLKIFSGLE